MPGHLGEVWMGTTPNEFFTLTAAQLTLENNIALRVQEFGSDFARCIAAGAAEVTLNFNIFEWRMRRRRRCIRRRGSGRRSG